MLNIKQNIKRTKCGALLASTISDYKHGYPPTEGVYYENQER